MKPNKSYIPLYGKVVAVFLMVLVAILFATTALIAATVSAIVENRLEKHTLNVARVVAHTPAVYESLAGDSSMEEFKSLLSMARNATQLEIQVYDKSGMLFGELAESRNQLVDRERNALEGQELVRVTSDEGGGDLRVFTPVYRQDKVQVGVVGVGMSLQTLEDAVWESKAAVRTSMLFGLLFGLGGAFFLASNVKASLFGLEPFEIAKLLEERNAILYSVREGILAIAESGEITLVNGEGEKLLSQAGIEGPYIGRQASAVIPEFHLDTFLAEEANSIDEQQTIKGLNLVTSRVPVIINGQVAGVVVTFRDTTQVRRLAEQLTGVRSYVEALRSQTHEFMNKLHVILGLTRMKAYDEVMTYISRITKDQGDEIQFVGRRIKDPVLAGFILGKLSRSRELGVHMELLEDSMVTVKDSEAIHDIITILGNLVDNAFDAVEKSEKKEVLVGANQKNSTLSLIVSDTGAGISDENKERIFRLGFSTKSPGRGIGLAIVLQSLDALGGEITYTSSQNQGTTFSVTIPLKEDMT